MLLDLRPLARYPDYRRLVIGQTISYFGSMMSYVAVPWQVYELTHSTFLVGLLGAVELVPLLVFALIGGSVADSIDRRRLLLVSEFLLSLGVLGLAINASLARPSVVFIFVTTAVVQAITGFHRPAMDAMVQKVVPPSDFTAVGAINTFRGSLGAIFGPSLGGLVIATGGVKSAYFIDFLTFLAAVAAFWNLSRMPVEKARVSHGKQIAEGLRFALSRPELMGTYVVDIVAMTFAFPIALFPAIGETFGGAKSAGLLFSAMAVGSLVVTLFSGWTAKVRSHGKCVVVAAALWGLAIIAMGFSRNLWVIVLCLAAAGAADTVSAIFRQVIWNETIPNQMRGRLAGIEMISYMSGPLLGNTRAGWVASVSSVKTSLISGGVLCFAGVALCGLLLPAFWRHRSSRA